MKLYSTVCWGLLVFMVCNTPKPVAVSDFCQVAGPEIVRLRSLTEAETAALTRPRKEAILNLRQMYKQLCH